MFPLEHNWFKAFSIFYQSLNKDTAMVKTNGHFSWLMPPGRSTPISSGPVKAN